MFFGTVNLLLVLFRSLREFFCADEYRSPDVCNRSVELIDYSPRFEETRAPRHRGILARASVCQRVTGVCVLLSVSL